MFQGVNDLSMSIHCSLDQRPDSLHWRPGALLGPRPPHWHCPRLLDPRHCHCGDLHLFSIHAHQKTGTETPSSSISASNISGGAKFDAKACSSQSSSGRKKDAVCDNKHDERSVLLAMWTPHIRTLNMAQRAFNWCLLRCQHLLVALTNGYRWTKFCCKFKPE